MGKRNLPSEKLTKEKPHLSCFLGPRSWFLFDKLNLKENQEWLSIPAKYWDGFSGYKIAKYFVESLLTVNDPAERGIKLISELKDCCRDPAEQELLAQVIEDHRKTFPSNILTKKKCLIQMLIKFSKVKLCYFRHLQ